MSILSNTGIRAGASGAGGEAGYQVANSLRFNDDDSAYLNKTPSGTGNQKTWTFSHWIKKHEIGGTQGYFTSGHASGHGVMLIIRNSDNLSFFDHTGSYNWQLVSDKEFRDTSAWYHIVCSVDTTQATASDRVKVYVNGEQLTSWSTSNYPSQNFNCNFNSTTNHLLGAQSWDGSVNAYRHCSLADVHFVDGLQLDATSFGEEDEDTGQWVPKEYTHSTSDWHTVNDGTTWSDETDSGLTHSDGPTGMFDGSLSTTGGAPSTENGYKTLVDSATISASTGIRIYWNGVGSGQRYIRINGTTELDDGSAQLTPGWSSVSSFSGTINKIEVKTASSGSWSLSAVEVDGYILVDDTVDNSFHLKFDNTSDLGEDSSGNDNDWTANNLVGSVIESLPCVEFDGSGDYLSLPYSSDLNLSNNDFTIEFWLYPDGPFDANDNGLIAFGDNNSGYGKRELLFNGYLDDGGTALRLAGSSDGTNSDIFNYEKVGNATLYKWQHLALVRNGSNFNVYKDGVSIFSKTISATFNAQTSEGLVIGNYKNSGTASAAALHGYLSNVRVVIGSALYTSNFTPPTAPLTNVTNTKLLCCQSDSSATTDNSDSSHTITANGDAAATTKSDAENLDLLADSPSTYDDGGNGVGNYATLNPLDNNGITLSNGNLTAYRNSSSWAGVTATFGMDSGLWYWEHVFDTQSTSYVGLTKEGWDKTYVGSDANSWGYYPVDGKLWAGGSGSSYGASWTGGDVMGVAFDADNGTLIFYKNGVSQGTAATGLTSGPYFPGISLHGTITCDINFGQRPFEETPPTGYKALNTFNLDDPLIDDPSLYFDVKTWDGNGSTQSITGLGFSPDFLWLKCRNTAYDHRVFDTIRGYDERLGPNITDEAYADTSLTSFDSDGFSLSSNTTTNGSGKTIVAWAWNAGGSTVTRTDGSIDSEVRANPTAGFSIVKWEGQGAATNIGHGLNAVPGLIISKCLDSSQDWNVWHTGLGANSRVFLNTNVDAESGGYPTVPTSSIFYVDNTGNFPSGEDIISYVWSEVEGYSKISQYTSSGGTDNFIYTGFRPAFLIAKRVVSSADNTYEGWIMFDSKRGAYNINDESLYANETHTEGKRGQGSAAGSTFGVDFLSNGFSFYDNATEYNRADEEQYIYYAVAETPFKYSNAR